MSEFSIWKALVVLLVVAVTIVPYVKILQKAGFSRWLVFFWLIPLVNIIFLWWFAFTEWPNQKEEMR